MDGTILSTIRRNCQWMPGGRSRWRREVRVPAATSSAASDCGRPAEGNRAKSTGQSGAAIWMAASLAITCPMRRRILLWRLWPTCLDRGGALKLSSRLRKATWGWTSTRPAPGLGGIITWPCACWLGLSCWACCRPGEKDAPDHLPPGLSGGAVDATPAAVRTRGTAAVPDRGATTKP